MKNQGGRRSSPAEQVVQAPCIYCTQCNFKARNKSEMDEYMKRTRMHMPTGPFYLLTGRTGTDPLPKGGNASSSCNQEAAKMAYHVIFLTMQFTKKAQKVPKLCFNGPMCTWKPGCLYIHPEDGDIMPNKANNQQGRGKICHWSAGQCPQLFQLGLLRALSKFQVPSFYCLGVH